MFRTTISAAALAAVLALAAPASFAQNDSSTSNQPPTTQKQEAAKDAQNGNRPSAITNGDAETPRNGQAPNAANRTQTTPPANANGQSTAPANANNRTSSSTTAADQSTPAEGEAFCRTRKEEGEDCACLKDPWKIGVARAAADGGKNECVVTM